MIEKVILFIAVFLGGVLPVLAQSHEPTPPPPNFRTQALSGIAQLVSVEEYITATQVSSSSLPPVERLPAGSFTLHRQKASLLLHLKDNHNQVALQVTNAVGNIVQTSPEIYSAGGFYELSILSNHSESGIYVVKLIVNEQVVIFRTVR